MSKIHHALHNTVLHEGTKEQAQYGRCSIPTIIYLLTTHEEEFSDHISTILHNAIRWKNRELIKHIFETYPDDVDVHDVLTSAVSTLNPELVYFVLSLTDEEVDWDTVIKYSSSLRAHLHMIYLIRHM